MLRITRAKPVGATASPMIRIFGFADPCIVRGAETATRYFAGSEVFGSAVACQAMTCHLPFRFRNVPVLK